MTQTINLHIYSNMQLQSFQRNFKRIIHQEQKKVNTDITFIEGLKSIVSDTEHILDLRKEGTLHKQQKEPILLGSVQLNEVSN